MRTRERPGKRILEDVCNLTAVMRAVMPTINKRVKIGTSDTYRRLPVFVRHRVLLQLGFTRALFHAALYIDQCVATEGGRKV